jgi:hypothetical protein
VSTPEGHRKKTKKGLERKRRGFFRTIKDMLHELRPFHVALVGWLVILTLPIMAIFTTNTRETDSSLRVTLKPGHMGISHVVRFADWRIMALQLLVYAAANVYAVHRVDKIRNQSTGWYVIAGVIIASISLICVRLFPYYSDTCTESERDEGNPKCNSKAVEKFYHRRHELIALILATVPVILYAVAVHKSGAQSLRNVPIGCAVSMVVMIVVWLATFKTSSNAEKMLEVIFELTEWITMALVISVPLLYVYGYEVDRPTVTGGPNP